MSAGRRLAVGGQLIRARLHAIELQGLTIRIHRNLVVAIAVAVPHLDIGVEAVVVVVACRGERMRRRFAPYSRRGIVKSRIKETLENARASNSVVAAVLFSWLGALNFSC